MERPISLPASIKDLYDRAEAAIQELQSIRNDIKAIQAAQGNAADVVKTENGKIPERYLPSGIKPLPSWFTIDNARSNTSHGGVYPSAKAGRRALNWYTNVADWNFDTNITLVGGAKISGTISNSDHVYGYDFPTLKSKILDGANLNGVPGNGTVTTESIQNNSITTEKISDHSITTEKIINNSITSDKLTNSSVTTEKVVNNSITTEKIHDGAITNEKLAPNSIGTTNLIDNSISTDKIINGAIAETKLADNSVTRNKIVQNIDLRGPSVKVDGKKIATEEYVTAHAFQLTNGCIETNHIKADIELRGTNVQANGGKIATETFVNDQLNSKLNLTGGTLTGPLTVQKLIVGNLEISVE
jgi:hypothetical protein